MSQTPDRRPGPLEEDEEFRLIANATGPSQAGAMNFDGTSFVMRDSLGNFNPRAGGGVTSFDFLLVVEPPVPDNNYSNTVINGKVTQELWKRLDTTNIKSIDYTYTSGKVTTEVRKVFAANGITITAQATITYTYSGSSLTSYAWTRDV